MIISRTPLRISFLGGGTDFPEFYNEHGGAVISCAIDKYIYVIIKDRFDDQIVLHYTKTEAVDRPEDIEHEIVKIAMMVTGLEKGIEVCTLGDIPSEGSGLGSSSTLTVGLLHAFYAYQGIEVGPDKLAEEAFRIESEIMGKSLGKQDQYIAAYGGLRMFIFGEAGVGSSHFKRAGRKQIDNRMMLFYTGMTRQSENILDQQQKQIAEKAEVLQEMHILATQGRLHLDREDFTHFGRVIKESWELKKTLADGISNPQINDMIADAINASAIGYKICGAGGGGFLLVYSDDKERVRQGMTKYKELPVRIEEQGSKIIYRER